MGRPRPAEPDPDHAGGGRTMAALDPRALRVYVLTSELARACADAGVLFVINDRPEIAVKVGAGGAHVGRADDPSRARLALGPERVLGMSINDATQTREAEELGADYIGVTVWATPTKPEANPGGLALVRTIADRSV